MTGIIDPLELTGAEPEPAIVREAAGVSPETLERVRELVLLAHPEVVPELVRGVSLTELLASVKPAHQAYTDLAARFQPDEAPPILQVPAGGTGPAPVDLDRIPTAEKLRRGIRDRLSQSRR